MTKLIINRSDGKSYLLTAPSPLRLLDITGIDSPFIEVFSEKRAVGSGDVITASRIGTRKITIIAEANTNIEATRKEISTFFVPNYTYTLHIEHMGIVRLAKLCRLIAKNLCIKYEMIPLRLSLTFLCPSGYLTGPEEQGEDINDSKPRFGFPLIFTPNVGTIFGLRLHSGTARIANTGDGETYIRFLLVNIGANNVVNPSITVNGFTVRVLVTLKPHDNLEIDTEHQTVRLNGVNCLYAMDMYSRIGHAVLKRGVNSITYNADANLSQLAVRIFYDLRYLGI